MNRNERLDSHQKFKELAALAQRGTLGQSEASGWNSKVISRFAAHASKSMTSMRSSARVA
jgi:hypothetical protein